MHAPSFRHVLAEVMNKVSITERFSYAHKEILICLEGKMCFIKLAHVFL